MRQCKTDSDGAAVTCCGRLLLVSKHEQGIARSPIVNSRVHVRWTISLHLICACDV